jgi:hypothetical protein
MTKENGKNEGRPGLCNDAMINISFALERKSSFQAERYDLGWPHRCTTGLSNPI